MISQVIIKENSKTGNVVNMRTITDKAGVKREVASIMIQQTSMSGISRMGRASVRTAFITLEQSGLELMKPYLIKDAVFPYAGKIVIKETLIPYTKANGETQEPKIDPRTREVITYQGQPVYRNSQFTEDINEADILLKDTPSNVDQSTGEITPA